MPELLFQNTVLMSSLIILYVDQGRGKYIVKANVELYYEMESNMMAGDDRMNLNGTDAKTDQPRWSSFCSEYVLPRATDAKTPRKHRTVKIINEVCMAVIST